MRRGGRIVWSEGGVGVSCGCLGRAAFVLELTLRKPAMVVVAAAVAASGYGREEVGGGGCLGCVRRGCGVRRWDVAPGHF